MAESSETPQGATPRSPTPDQPSESAPTASPYRPNPTQTNRILAASLVAGGLLMIAVGIILGAAVEPFLYLVCIAGLIDLALAWAFATNRIGPAAARRRNAETSGDAAALAAEDPSYNPYARED